MKRLLCFHPALAPYRVDFFDMLAHAFDMKLILFDSNLPSQKFDQGKLIARIACPVEYLTGGFKWKDRYFRTGAIRKIIREKPDIVLGCEYSIVTISAAIYRAVSRAKFKIYTMTDDNVEKFYARRGLRAFVRWLCIRLLDGTIVTSEEVAAVYKTATPKRCRHEYPVVPIIHDEIRMRQNAAAIISKGYDWRKEHIGSFKKIVLFVGRLEVEKNLPWLIEQMPLIDSSAVLVIVGSGSEREMLQARADTLAPGRVFFVGRMEGDAVYEMMSMADVLVLPSLYEAFGAVVGEAMIWGTPCLVSDHAGAKTIIREGVNGAVFHSGNSADFVRKLHDCISLTKTGKSLLDRTLSGAVADLVKVLQ